MEIFFRARAQTEISAVIKRDSRRVGAGIRDRDEVDGSGSRDIVSLIMSPWRMETRLRAKAPCRRFWPMANQGTSLCMEIREPLDIFHELSNRWEIRSQSNAYAIPACTSDACDTVA